MPRRAFTLIELLVVISIISLLSSVVLAALNTARTKGKIGAGLHFSAQIDHVAGDQAVGLWDFDECSGSTTADRSGLGYTATPNGAAFSATTPTNRDCSMFFDGVNDYIDTQSPAADYTTWTMAAWVYDTKANNAYRAIIQTSSQTTGDYAFYIYPGNYPAFYNCGASSITAAFPSNEWVHVAAVYDSAVGFKYYQNGALVGTRSGGCTAANHWEFIHLGGIDTTDGERWKGYIDSVHIYSKTLTAQEIGNLYAEGRSAHPLAARE